MSECQKENVQSTIARTLTYFRKRGLIALPKRIQREFASPSTPLGIRILPITRALLNINQKNIRSTRHKNSNNSIFINKDTLLCFYDMEYWPITYDFGWFLAAADLTRRIRDLRRCAIYLIAPRDWENGPESTEYLKIIDGAARHQRVHDILLPSTTLAPHLGDVSLVMDRGSVARLTQTYSEQVFPAKYSPTVPYLDVPFPAQVNAIYEKHGLQPQLRAPESARAWVRRRIAAMGAENRRLIVITLRNYPYTPSRNSDLEAWTTLAAELESQGYAVVFVPDTHAVLDGIPEILRPFDVSVETAWSVPLRAALYETAWLNLSVNTGPMGLFCFNPNTRYIVFKAVVPDAPVTLPENIGRSGIDPTKPFPFATPYQILTVAQDTLPEIREATYDMLDKLDRDSKQ